MLFGSPWGWSRMSSNLPLYANTGTPTNNYGTNFTINANSTKGTTVSLIANLQHDVHYLTIGINGTGLSTADCNALIDIMVDPAGGTSWSNGFIDNLCAGSVVTSIASNPSFQWYHFPIWIKSGTSLGIRGQTRHTANLTTVRAILVVYGEPSRPEMWWCGQKVETIGANTAASKGINITPGNSSAWGNWANATASSYNYGAVQFGLNATDSSTTAVNYFFQFGIDNLQLPGSQTYYGGGSTAELMGKNATTIIPCNTPANTVFQCRGTASGTAEIHNYCVYGVY